MSPNLAHSIQVRLVRHAKELDLDPNLVLARYGAERLLYRLSQSRHADRFVLKGALLMLVWLGEGIRPTRGTDLLGFGEFDAGTLERIFTELCASEVQPDGLVFDPASIKVAAIRPEDAYGGQRVALIARLEKARLRIQVDVGIGDAVSPAPEWIEYPSLLDLPRPRLRAYRPETTIAEKGRFRAPRSPDLGPRGFRRRRGPDCPLRSTSTRRCRCRKSGLPWHVEARWTVAVQGLTHNDGFPGLAAEPDVFQLRGSPELFLAACSPASVRGYVEGKAHDVRVMDVTAESEVLR